MTAHYMGLLFTPAVLAEQAKAGSRDSYARLVGGDTGAADLLGPKEAMFLATRDSFYVASTNASGWPYVQHRGGPPGFVKLLGDRRIGFADYR
ncbi:MAG TPA: pyridoxamine 5'-phosphate oxidase family protein, partial [Sphingomonas sp.]